MSKTKPISSRPAAEDKYRNEKGILQIVQDGLCHHCGACIGFCPVGTFGLDENAYPIQVDKCIDCNICVRDCSGIEVDYDGIGTRLFGENYQYGSFTGWTEETYIGHAKDNEIRRNGASGGVVTQLLAHLIDTKQIAGAVVVIEDPDEPARGKGIIARNRDDLLKSQQSRYTTAPALAALQEIQKEDGPFALVGLPCQIHALRKHQMFSSSWKRRVPIVIGLFCHFNLPMSAVKETARTLGPKRERLLHAEFRSKDPRGWPYNTWEMTFSGGTVWRSPHGPSLTFNVISRVTKLGRCLQCLDATSEFADLAIGDPWIRDEKGNWKYDTPEGWSSIMVRTNKGGEIVQDVISAGKLEVRPIPLKEIQIGQHLMMTEKKLQSAFRIQVRKFLRIAAPSYSMRLPRVSYRIIKTEIAFWFLRTLPFSRSVSRMLMRLGFSKFGVWALARHKQRRIKRITAGKVRIVDPDFGVSEKRT